LFAYKKVDLSEESLIFIFKIKFNILEKMANETIELLSGQIRIGHTYYASRNISSVRTDTIIEDTGCFCLFAILISSIGFYLGYIGIRWSIFMIIFGIYFFISELVTPKVKEYSVIITTNAGEISVLETTNLEEATIFEESIRKAISSV
jgi:glucan phosphoethanolaminetransferase (alkaline phosphatase superfamily)